MKNSMYRLAAAVFPCLLLASGGCKRTAAVGAVAERQVSLPLSAFMPLSLGNSWTYATSFQGQPQPDLTVRIVRREGAAYVDDSPTSSRWIIDAEGIRDGSRRYVLKKPLAKGTEWMSVADVRTVEHYRIVDTNRRVTVPAGTFDSCILVRMTVRIDDKRSMENDMVFAPHVGIVRISTRLVDGGRILPQSDMRLKKYELVKKGGA
ncbi:MAG: hypothetical protein D6806_18395 [Deltaproteobacteria bacterium]|nr:MAG: hypothetical protein D6806_18395 [Deltaproteobacteria bacterium]